MVESDDGVSGLKVTGLALSWGLGLWWGGSDDGVLGLNVTGLSEWGSIDNIVLFTVAAKESPV